MRGITSLIDTDKDDSTQFIDENLILSSASESEIPPKPASRLKNADLFTKPKVAPRKQKAVKEAAPKKAKAAGKATATKRKAPEEENSDGASPAAKKSFTAATALSGDELDAATGGSEPKQVTKPKAKRKAKAKGTVERDDVPEIGISQAHPTLAQDGIKMPRVNQNMSDNATVPEVESKDEENKACSPLAPVRKPVPAMSRPRLDDRCVKRAGSASDTERAGGDPNLRRKLGDVTRKFENVDLKYRNLKEVGIVEANANMEKVRKQCEATTAASSELIASLKKELAMQMPLAQEARQLQTELKNSKNEAARSRSAVSDLESSLAAARNEIKALQAKLAAARSSATSVEGTSAKTPGSVIKNAGQVRTVMVGSAEAAHAAQTAQLKEDLYSDLTGLIIRNIKKTGEGDAYDCIQTGRNGTLHFKLVVEAEGDGRTTSFEETEFLYTPLLDSNRDKEMIELLPYYLKEDITFSRHHAAKFYNRVADALTKTAE